MVYYRVTCDYPEYVTYESAPVTGTLYLGLPVKMCQLTKCCGTTILVKVASVLTAETASPVYLRTCCGAAVPLVNKSAGAAVTGANLTLDNWYEIRVRCIDGVAQGVVQSM